ncbi:MAG: histidine phosphatase family protein [Proteobacteria bacterium]|nr:histidine phosphatase family protein [Pseudomonadota bacterium]
MQFYFIRHAQSENNVLMAKTVSDRNDLAGYETFESNRFANAELTDLGRKQADRLGRFIASQRKKPSGGSASSKDDFEFTHLYSSPMVRAMDTAAQVAEASGAKPVVWKDLHEQGGVWTKDEKTGDKIGLAGDGRSDLEKKYSQFAVPDTIGEDGWWNRSYEEPHECFQRAGGVLEKLLGEHDGTDDRVAMVSHGNFYNHLLYNLLELSPEKREFGFTINNVAVTRIDFNGGIKMFVYQNRTDFLPADLTT